MKRNFSHKKKKPKLRKNILSKKVKALRGLKLLKNIRILPSCVLSHKSSMMPIIKLSDKSIKRFSEFVTCARNC